VFEQQFTLFFAFNCKVTCKKTRLPIRKIASLQVRIFIRKSSDAQFTGFSSVPAHVEMMGFLGIGNNPMVGCSVACAVNVDLALNKK